MSSRLGKTQIHFFGEKMKKREFVSRRDETPTFEPIARHAAAQARSHFLMKMSVSRRRDAAVPEK